MHGGILAPQQKRGLGRPTENANVSLHMCGHFVFLTRQVLVKHAACGIIANRIAAEREETYFGYLITNNVNSAMGGSLLVRACGTREQLWLRV